jgi:glycerol-3-phosphate cytidylyltransferase
MDRQISGTRIIGYTHGSYDLFHLGHLNILRNAKSMCDKLIVGIKTDEYIEQTKNKKPVIPFAERMEIVRAVSYVDTVVPHGDWDTVQAWSYYKFHITFVGDDWKGSEKWKRQEAELAAVNVPVIYFPYTQTTSSTKITALINDRLDSVRIEPPRRAA